MCINPIGIARRMRGMHIARFIPLFLLLLAVAVLLTACGKGGGY